MKKLITYILFPEIHYIYDFHNDYQALRKSSDNLEFSVNGGFCAILHVLKWFYLIN